MTDYVDTLLRRHGRTWQDDFLPPPLAPMLKTALESRRNHRWVPALVAAVLILAIPIGTVIAVHLNRTETPAASQVFPFPQTIEQDGQTMQRSTDLPWSDAVVSPDGRQITVQVTDTDPRCDAPTIKGSVTVDGSQSVTIAVTTYVSTGPVLQCIRLAPDPQAVSISLNSALGNRRLIDHFDGKTHLPLQSQSMPQLTYLPSGYGNRPDTALTWDEKNQSATKSYPDLSFKGTTPTPTLTVSRTTPQPHQIYAGVGGKFPVLGRLASITAASGPAQRICVEWQDPTYFWSVCSSAPFSDATLLKIANSLR